MLESNLERPQAVVGQRPPRIASGAYPFPRQLPGNLESDKLICRTTYQPVSSTP